ncbi:gamma-glutamylcyclotransferase [Nodosilinea sp. P-1105]|uniref:gamma-glutamylcyclotransferase n=1 Tax=Nodosilinea sp. P-1105 TaxID=2546229 RepID=UPI00146A34A7|nr:gamma-glutamylcyclotransferase [Nodosilinea sp. P-1105]NMF83692.1 gamma-glutamylcyclotransferase [Nodosilinea sp. P-1105]
MVSATDSQPILASILPSSEPTFYYFAYGSCMCPVDLKRSLGENTHPYVVGAATLQHYRLGFHYFSPKRQCGALDIVSAPKHSVQGVLYRLPWRLSPNLDQREGVHQGGYRQQFVTVHSPNRVYHRVRTYTVIQKTPKEVAPNDWYFGVVLRGAITCQLPEPYCWQLFQHMRTLQMA